jgi:hypothetical protein
MRTMVRGCEFLWRDSGRVGRGGKTASVCAGAVGVTSVGAFWRIWRDVGVDV